MEDLESLIKEFWDNNMRERPGIGNVMLRLGGCIQELPEGPVVGRRRGDHTREKNRMKATIAVGQEMERLSCGEAESFDHLVGTPQ